LDQVKQLKEIQELENLLQQDIAKLEIIASIRFGFI